ncbi:hypothetical protein SAMN05216388_102351 [Halorientalis persicus]|uniref:Uncharacterized protein n=1 Tax=Halorientalis persicus TaxID=1367881 RepID=A0A1H8TP94_9EURY|nr:hypothetical protein [Halorientalis persicus]SEO92782.1 hypothetical protein SAMN05216388_102351 [Halorientalis persicus]
MSSRDPSELREALGEIDFDGEPEQLPELREEARETVAAQRETLNDIDTKASRILRLNVALVGILVSVLSIATQLGSGSGSSAAALDQFVNIYTEFGIGALVLSTAFAAMTYTASELDVGVSSENLANLLRADFTAEDTEELLVKNYIMRINFNRSTNVRNIPLIQMTIILLVSAIVAFLLGVYTAIVGAVPTWLVILAVALILGVVIVSGLVTQIWRAFSDLREWH